MSREVKVHNMPEEEKNSLMDSMLARVIATLIASLLVIIIGQGLLIWKDQDSLETKLIEHEEDILEIHDISDRLITLESLKTQAFRRLEKLEDYMQDTVTDRSQRGGSFRRNDAEIMKSNILGKIDIEDGRISNLEYRMDTVSEKVNECRENIPRYALKTEVKEIADDLEELEDEFETSYEDLTERCKQIVDILEKEEK